MHHNKIEKYFPNEEKQNGTDSDRGGERERGRLKNDRIKNDIKVTHKTPAMFKASLILRKKKKILLKKKEKMKTRLFQ